VGITSGRRILREIQKLPVAKTPVMQVYESRNGGVVSVYDNDSINTALQLFKEHKISKLVVIDKNMKLQGILSYYDLVPYLIADGQGEKRRSLKSKEKEHLMNMKVKGYAKKTMLTVSPETSVDEAINEMITRGMGSVVIIDHESNPVGIVTTKDIFNLLKPNATKKSVELTAKNISQKNEDIITNFVSYVSEHTQRIDSIQDVRVLVEEEKHGILFKVSVYINPKKDKKIVISKEGKDLVDIIKETKQALQTQLSD
jgi:CBS domain-containing protein